MISFQRDLPDLVFPSCGYYEIGDLLSTHKEKTAIRRGPGEAHFSHRRGKTFIWYIKGDWNYPPLWF